jgi:hypothetical protein
LSNHITFDAPRRIGDIAVPWITSTSELPQDSCPFNYPNSLNYPVKLVINQQGDVNPLGVIDSA